MINFPHGRCYFAMDDRFVKHYRRYDLGNMFDQIKNAGLRPILVLKVLELLEKVTMCIVYAFFTILHKWRSSGYSPADTPIQQGITGSLFKWCNRAFTHLSWLDAFIALRLLSTVLLINVIREEGYEEWSQSHGIRD